MSASGQTMPFDSCPSNVRFRFLLPENCHSASGPLRSWLLRALLRHGAMSDLSPKCAPKRKSTDHSDFMGSRPSSRRRVRSQSSNLPYRLRAVDSRNPRTQPRASVCARKSQSVLRVCTSLVSGLRLRSARTSEDRPGGPTSRPIVTGSITIGRRNDWLVGSHSFQRSRYLARS